MKVKYSLLNLRQLFSKRHPCSGAPLIGNAVIIMNTLALVILVFVFVKYSFELLGWLTFSNKDEIYRRHLDSIWDKLNKYKFYELSFLLTQRLISRLKLIQTKWPNPIWFIILFIAVFLNYTTILISFSVMAQRNPNFVFEDKSLAYTVWVLFRELKIWGSQQILWILIINTILSIFSFSVSRRLILKINSTTKGLQHFLLASIQLIVFLFVFGGMYLSMYTSVTFYDWGSNTESQQYLLTQSARMLISPDNLFLLILSLNAAASIAPSIIFIVLISFLFISYFIPVWLQKFINHIIFLISTDNKPIFNQLGSFFGALAAIVTAIFSYLKNTMG